MRLLAKRFGELPPWAEERLQHASPSELENWLDLALSADSLPDLLVAMNTEH